jgi:hypothetical protein
MSKVILVFSLLVTASASIDLIILIETQVTGASGYLGSHIVTQLLEKGYQVKAWVLLHAVLVIANFHFHSAARGRKAEALQVLHADNPSVEVVEISDIVHGQFQDALVDVDAVIHVASPLPGRADPQEMMDVRSVSIFRIQGTDFLIGRLLSRVLWMFYDKRRKQESKSSLSQAQQLLYGEIPLWKAMLTQLNVRYFFVLLKLWSDLNSCTSLYYRLESSDQGRRST